MLKGWSGSKLSQAVFKEILLITDVEGYGLPILMIKSASSSLIYA
jgi:hypothetical protein